MYPTPLRPPRKQRRSHKKKIIASALIVVIAAGYSAFAIARPFTQLQPTRTNTSLSVTTPASNLPWPAYGSGAFGLIDGTVVATNGDQSPVSIASVTKTITALVVMERFPLKADEEGPTYTITQRDVDSYNRYIAINGSVMPVALGQQLTLRDLIEGLMLPSANNVADTLAEWAYGSVPAYIDAANKYLAKQGLNQTKVGGDASGYLPDSTSTPSDLVKLGALAMRTPALADIVGEKTAVVPGTGTVRNYNNLLGTSNIVGVKTGNNDDNGGVFVGAARVNVGGKQTTVITALSGAPNLGRVLRDSGTLLAAAPANFATTTVVKKDTVLGTYRQTNGELLQAVVNQDINVVVLRGDSVNATLDLKPINYAAKAGDRVGTITVPATDLDKSVSVPITLKQTPTKPDILYRLLHP